MTNSIKPKQFLFAFHQGAFQLIDGKQMLNQINVFPVSDGDTGSNLASLMQTIIEETSEESTSVIEILKKIADASLTGARGNSGIIFAQYLNGIYNHLLRLDGKDSIISIIESAKLAVEDAYQAIENPVEGTMITVIRMWAEALIVDERETLEATLLNALNKAKLALDNTPRQLKILQKNNVVDAGANGFYLFIRGFTYAFTKEQSEVHFVDKAPVSITYEGHNEAEKPTFRYCTEVLLDNVVAEKKEIQEQLSSLGDSLIVAVNRGKARIHIHSNLPKQVLAYLRSVGRPIQQKVDDMLLQYNVKNNRKASIALVTDSIADLPKQYVLDNQIHVLPMTILIENVEYIDKVTIDNTDFFELAGKATERSTSSQPSLKKINELFSYLEAKYKEVIVVSVSAKLSGTFQTIDAAAKRFSSNNFNIKVIDSKQNSAAQGLLIMLANEMIQKDSSFDEIVEQIIYFKDRVKIFVSVANLQPMIDSGRIPSALGKFAQKIHLKPIVSLDKNGYGKLADFTFSLDGNERKIIRKIVKLNKKNKIEKCLVVHTGDEEKARLFASILEEKLEISEINVVESSAVIAMSAGSGSVAAAIVLKEMEG